MNPVLRHLLAGLVIAGVWGHAYQVAWSQDAADAATPADAAAKPANDAVAGSEDTEAKSSPLVVEPKTPAEIFDATLLMLDINRPQVAKQFLKKFLADEPSDELLLQLRQQYGPAAFLRLANVKELLPEAKGLLDRNNAVFTKFANDPARLAALISDLVSPNLEQRTVAEQQVITAGVSIVPALIRAIGEPKFQTAEPKLVEMLVRIGVPAVAPMHAALSAPDLKTRLAIILGLGLIGDDSSVPYLLQFAGQIESTQETDPARKAIRRIVKSDSQLRLQLQNVATRLLQTAREYYLGRHTWEIAGDNLVSTWVWHQPIGTVVERRLSPADASRQEGIYFAKVALNLAPTRSDIQTTYLNLLFAEEVASGALSKPLSTGPGSTQDLAASLGPNAVALALSEAMELNKSDSALVAVQVLAKIGTVQQVRVVNGRLAALQRALNYPSRRVQFAAAQTIVQLDPQSSYPGIDRVVAILGRALTQMDSTEKQALVLDSVADRGQAVAGFLNDLGYSPTHRLTGREGFQTAATAQELDLIIIDANIQRWGLSETLTNFKHDPRTMDVPILIYGEAVTERDLRVYIRQFPQVSFIEIPATSDDLRSQVATILALQSEPPLTAGERSSKALRAAELLSFISSGQRKKLYDLTRIEKPLLAAVENSQAAVLLMPAISSLASIAAQQRLAASAADETQSVEVRLTAAQQLAIHLRRFGLLITTEQVERLREGWAQTQDNKLHAELSAVMGILQPNATLIGERLRGSSAAVAPAPSPEVKDPATETPAEAPTADSAAPAKE